MLTWGINNGHEWDCAAAGPAGLTPLHLAALLDDGGRIADELTGLSCHSPKQLCKLFVHAHFMLLRASCCGDYTVEEPTACFRH